MKLPTDNAVRSALDRLQAATTSTPPTVVALAKEVGLSNSTFWRHFPDVAQRVADTRRRAPEPTATSTSAAARFDPDENRRIRAENSHLREQLAIAAAHIQYLTLENHGYREQLERASEVTRLPRRY
ncbi:hypothetical protein [Mycobacterium sp. OTB74]|uniref:hypothetical protein n=1 Tax=Mycobacterium sp. OTB74 TaxID=1853452 RepID=UPI0024750129|nr:hypothetical protein [Mycobacterium sp. OTB74]